MTMIMGTGEPARVDDWAAIPGPLAEMIRHHIGARSSVGCSIVVVGEVWGGLAVHSTRPAPLAADTESRLRNFADLVATAIANSDTRAEVTRLAQEQAALRRVATLVARGTGPDSVFRAVADEVGAFMGCDTAAIVRFEADGWATVMGAHRARRAPGTRFEPEPGYVVASVQSTGQAARFDTDDPAAAGMPDAVRAEGIRSGLAAPIVVNGDLWGTITVASLDGPIPGSTEQRLADFTELVATAISNSEARADVARLAEEQAALRRVATLVARGVPADALFGGMCEEVEAVVGSEVTVVVRFEADGTVTIMGTDADRHPVGARLDLDPDYVVAEVHRTGRAARFDADDPASPDMPEVIRGESVRSALASPIVVEGQLWGAITTASRERRLPAGMERRLADFTELVATAIANSHAGEQVTALAHEQAALRRVATLVAKEASPAEVFAPVAEEVTRAFAGVQCLLFRYEGDGTATAIAVFGPGVMGRIPLGEPMAIHDGGVLARVLREGRPSRIDDYSAAPAPLAEETRRRGVGAGVGSPIVVGDRTWGAMLVASHDARALHPEIETGIAQFADLVATAVANADAHAAVERLAEEQAALRRVATLVAREAPLEAVFAKVAEELARTLREVDSALWRDDGDATATAVAVRA